MAGLQRSQVSFRRQGSSGLIWDDKLLSEEINNKTKNQETEHRRQDQDQEKTTDGGDLINFVKPIKTVERSRSVGGGGRGYRTGRVSPAIEPPSPRLSVCGFCGSFGKQSGAIPKAKNRRERVSGKPRSRSANQLGRESRRTQDEPAERTHPRGSLIPRVSTMARL